MKLFKQYLRFLLLITGLICAALAYSNYWLSSELAQYEREVELNDNDSPHFWRTANFDYEMDYVISPFILRFLNEETQERFYRITELDFRLDELDYYAPEDIAYYSPLKSVHTIKIKNLFVEPKMIEAFRSFSGLRRIEIDWYHATNINDNHIELTNEIIPGVQIVKNGG